MAKDQKHFWIVRRRWGDLAIPTLQEEVAQVFREQGWEVTELPGAALSEVERRCLRGASGGELQS